jgi:uncharacterized protein YdhG (YjbR/CyaY superfamily)
MSLAASSSRRRVGVAICLKDLDYLYTMALKDPRRDSHFPAIEKKYGQPMSYWFGVMAEIAELKYPEQVAHLRESFGFSQTHANALVMYSRGSKSSQRFTGVADFYKSIDKVQAKTLRSIFKAIKEKYPESDLVIAWNQPMLRLNGQYIFGASVSKNHISISPWSSDVIEKFAPKMKDLDVKKKMVGIPNDWVVDVVLLQSMVRARIKEF